MWQRAAHKCGHIPGHGQGLPVGDLGPELVPLFPAGSLGPIHVSPVALSFPSCETEVIPALVLLLLVKFGVRWLFAAGLRLSPAAASGGAALPCGAWASLVAEWGSVVVAHGLRCSTLVGSSRTRDGTRVPCIGRRILIHCTSREVHHLDSCVMRCSWTAKDTMRIKLDREGEGCPTEAERPCGQSENASVHIPSPLLLLHDLDCTSLGLSFLICNMGRILEATKAHQI